MVKSKAGIKAIPYENGGNWMRKRERDICDPKAIESIIEKATVCRLAMCDKGVPYLVPLCFGYENGALYFHSATEGTKLDILKRNSQICFEMDIDCELVRSGDRCSMRYRSVIGNGYASLVEDPADKCHALDLIMEHYRQELFAYPETALRRTVIIKVEIQKMTGKTTHGDV
jgi:nitroimidazol reductase NimA-like FMN-containing flavoprotein (pyridoxamine 5'-phosphate oxidase superfamily)